MFNHMVERSASLDDAYGSLAHPVRRAMLERLRGGAARVTELAQPFDISLAAASKHIGQLERAGLIERTVRGRDHWISLRPEPLEEATAWLALYRSFWNRRLDVLEDLLRAEADA
jgi:DNA-binding transcriptional ArsR family regulator